MSTNFLAILSPAKSLRTEVDAKQKSSPEFLARAEVINSVMKQKSPGDLMDLQSISSKLAELNADRNLQWSVDAHQAGIPALYCFTGDVYQGLDVDTLDAKALSRAEESLLILSGLYGVLRPLDGILPYRLEMGTKLPVYDAKNLYEFWQTDVTEFINRNYAGRTLINLASNEYASVVDRKLLKLPVIEVVFKDYSKDKYKIISFHAKKARGLFARFLIEQNPKSTKDLQSFSYGNYYFDAASSSDGEIVFLRD
jgi:cytoplasmic iron level regulating protein YaaA (DUF328/UPF0246 family)